MVRNLEIVLTVKLVDAPSAPLAFIDRLDRWLTELTRDSILVDYRIKLAEVGPVLVDFAEEEEGEQDDC